VLFAAHALPGVAHSVQQRTYSRLKLEWPFQPATTVECPTIGLAYKHPVWAAARAETENQSIFARQFADARADAAIGN
jgi:hypothetical protein